MAHAAVPLLHAEPADRLVGCETGLRLTDMAAQVFAGSADRVTLNGIDRWIGGVHLRGHHVPWRWDDATETITRTCAAIVDRLADLPPRRSPRTGQVFMRGLRYIPCRRGGRKECEDHGISTGTHVCCFGTCPGRVRRSAACAAD